MKYGCYEIMKKEIYNTGNWQSHIEINFCSLSRHRQSRKATKKRIKQELN